MQIHESFPERKGGYITHLHIEDIEVACMPCRVTIEVDDINRRDKTAYLSVFDVEPLRKEDQEYAELHPEDFDIDTDYNGIDDIVFKHLGMEA